MLEVIGWIGSILFAICGVPQAVDSIRKGSADGLNWAFLLMWFFGEVLTIAYVLPTKQYPLLFNYLCNLSCLLVILRYKILPRKPK